MPGDTMTLFISFVRGFFNLLKQNCITLMAPEGDSIDSVNYSQPSAKNDSCHIHGNVSVQQEGGVGETIHSGPSLSCFCCTLQLRSSHATKTAYFIHEQLVFSSCGLNIKR